MTVITIGVPVFNEEARLETCLAGLAAQTFGDFTALVFDNASTDATAEIAAAFAARDPRFRLIRQPENKGAMQNFLDALDAAQTPYFLWRAADDRSDANYLEVLHRLLEANPAKQLAVGRVIGTFRGETIRETRFPRLAGGGAPKDVRTLMFRSSASWIYGLFRRAALADVMRRAWAPYGDNGWAADFLVLLPFFMDDAVVGTHSTTFEAALRPRAGPPGQPPPPRTEADLDMLLQLRRTFLDIASTFVDERVAPGPGRAVWAALLFLYADRRVYKTRHIIRRSAKRLIGLKP
ncbi:MAG TPA: glycosyltransferase family 2 protein [Caulobacteraceae bacterium]|nr:glycosyltransferase family 2 protein [Caulobacteraceae bacterium]